ncbi:Arabinose 5-phosphate isomerase KpsF [Cyphellophora attinorum]|uniref:Arabinose 5-phosphate isomerase KpsF n=1 Tax=Cyphellophora attinorum TaxID=1664694 RepID=A0A0N1H441_9EURO|nr:Arabinose 5-phosphate isomerase KpsF [Phialophora attinorum]KPI39993.1 Arabinose 5-phosphate isomerase KpsF [Phialophora attinorum]
MAFTYRASLPTPVTPSMPVCAPLPVGIEPLPITPPDAIDDFDDKTFKPDSRIIKRALHVLSTERTALEHLEDLYRTSPDAQHALMGAVTQIIHTETRHGKVIFTGIGKSGHIATKLSATFNSLGIQSVCLHPAEALHGDLGVIRPNDTIVMITYSGRTPELLQLVRHIPSAIPIIIMTAHTNPHTCPLLTHPIRAASTGAQNFLLPTTLHETETTSFGFSAPTTSTTITLALGDSLALSVAETLHSDSGLETPTVFAQNHPGGAIGADHSQRIPHHQQSPPSPPKDPVLRMSDLATPLTSIPHVPGSAHCTRTLDILLTAARSPSGFVFSSPNHLIAPRRIQKFDDPSLIVDVLYDDFGRVVVEKSDWISILGETSVEEARGWIVRMREEGSGRGKGFLRHGTILGVVEGAEVVGVVEIEGVLGEEF